MKTTVDARGMACPEPVLLAQKALAGHDEVLVLVDDATAVENIRRLAVRTASGFSVTEEGGVFTVSLVRKGAQEPIPAEAEAAEMAFSCAVGPGPQTGPVVVVLSDQRMGRGDDTLGEVLMRAFLHALTEVAPLPRAVLCYNSGVKLAARDSPVLEDLLQMQRMGTKILVCGTCVNHFGLEGQIAAGRLSAMQEIAETLAGAVRLVRP